MKSRGLASVAALAVLVPLFATTGLPGRSAGVAYAAESTPPPPAPSSATLTTSAGTFVAGSSVKLTAETDVDVAPTASTITIVDESSNTTVASCTSGRTCTANVSFYTGPARDYVARVGALASAPVSVARAPWSVSLTSNKAVFSAGEWVTLTATANQNTGSTNGAYSILIFDKTTGALLGRCNGSTTCQASTNFDSGGPHSYVAFVAA